MCIFRSQLEELHRTAGANVAELKALLKQQEELILAIEGQVNGLCRMWTMLQVMVCNGCPRQMSKIRGLVGVRHAFMELVTGVTGFVIEYAEVVREVEKSGAAPGEKAKKYDEVRRSFHIIGKENALSERYSR